MTTPKETLTGVLRALQALRASEAAFLDVSDDFDGAAAIQEVLSGTPDNDEGLAVHEEMVHLLERRGGRVSLGVILGLLGHADERVRIIASDAVVCAGQEDFDTCFEVAKAAIDRATRSEKESDRRFLVSILLILAELGDEQANLTCRQLLEHPHADVVAAAIEAIGDLEDRASIPALRKLRKDARTTNIGSKERPEIKSIGTLATETIGFLETPH